MKKEEDKRLIIPKDAFEEEASEGLGKLNKEEAAEDLRELRGRMERRVRKPRMIWLPAAAAVVILLVASTVYIALFRDRSKPETVIAMAETAITDTALIAMAQPITIAETKTTARAATPNLGVVSTETTDEMKAGATNDLAAEDKDEVLVVAEAVEEEAVAEEVIVEAMPRMEKAAAYEKKERAADAAAAAPAQGVGMPERQTGPVGGMEEFNSWIQRNIKYPEEVVPRVRQVVAVTFKISADSTLYDLKTEGSAGEPFTKEAFRLLREGPKWVPAIRNNLIVEEEIRISIIFK
jgi:hypothetical protein